ncbi:efflux RND transporter periplasmic adaptor subunit [Rhizobium paknamense]|uniref:RND family efflux transporter MFP subunit n=1 Tax=Rhizobium paknamense TaxID=1206817 RepID=A0ABU0I7N9_9HYPH|nr:efflux RND transporter periplasmic adaptor subunit [Rhizobium paknamense]MDQ0454244.1 RND family efflux transporter MFP subunit [Rhizobium paknamense]
MKKLLLTSALLVVIAASGWVYRDRLPFLQQGANQPGAEQKQTADNQNAGGSGDAGGKRSGNRRGGGGPAAVKTVTASITNLPIDATATGWAEADDTTTIAALQAGLVTSIEAKDGQEIKEGALIAKLDDRVARATVDKDRANIASAEATLAEAEAAFQRAASLVKQSAQSQQTYEQAKAARDSAAASLDAYKATLESDQVTLEHMEIRAPYDGRLGSVQLSPGAYVSAGSTIVTITRYNPIYVKFQMSERYLPHLRRAFADKTVPVDVDPMATGGEPDRGVLSFFDNTVDSTSGTVAVKARFENSKGTLWPGQSVNVTVRFGTDDKNIVVPTVAVRPGADGNFVYTVDDSHKARMTPVKVLRSNGDMTAIASGLKEGQRVVVEGLAQLADGQPVSEQVADTPKPASKTVAENTTQEASP